MWLLPVTRRELVDLITPRREGDVPGVVEEHRPSFDIVRSEMMAAVWPARPAEFGRMPTVIVVPEGMRRDTLAWLSTYVRDFRPFTAYCRVVERPIAEQFLRGPSAPNLLGLEGICSGLILGEALTHGRGRASILDLPATSYSATLSHAISRAFALTSGSFPVDVIVRLWTQAREITGQNGLGVSPNAIVSVWAVALGVSGHRAQPRNLFEPTDVLGAAWAELNSAGEMRDPVWQRLIDGYPDLDRMRSLIEVPREQRVEAIDVALRILLSSKRGDEERRGFLAGYFTSLLGPGTLDHADFLGPVATAFPTAYLWYGLFGGANPRGDALPVGNPLARRIIRDLTIPDRLVDRPRCDVALEELAMHGPAENLLRLTAKAGRLDIDILPGVTTSVRWPPHEVPTGDELRRVRDMEVQHLLIEMEESSLRTRHLAERLRDILRNGDADRQQTGKKKRGGKS
jgi:hypothetical protein